MGCGMGKGECRGRSGHVRQAAEAWKERRCEMGKKEGRQLAIMRSWVK
jgi:hypothetical protein